MPFPVTQLCPVCFVKALEYDFTTGFNGGISLPEFCLQGHSFEPRTDIASNIVIHSVIFFNSCPKALE